MTAASELTTVPLFAVLVEMLVEYLVKPLLPKLSAGEPWTEDEADSESILSLALRNAVSGEGPGQPPEWWQTLSYSRYAAATLGVALCIAYRLDILAMLTSGLPDAGIPATYLAPSKMGWPSPPSSSPAAPTTSTTGSRIPS